MEKFSSPQEPQEITSMAIGDTVIAGMDVVDDSKIRKVPIISHLSYLAEYAKDSRFNELIESLLTGVVKTPISQITSGSVSRSGVAQGFEGPGMLTVSAGKLVVQSPNTFIWAFKTPYTYGVKTDKGLAIKENNKTIKVVSYDNINNNSVPHDYVSVSILKRWYLDADEDDKIAIDYGLSNFSDGRNNVTPSEIKKFFGESVVTYLENYPNGSPVMAYMHGYNSTKIASSVSYLGSYPALNDAKRAYNAKSFARAWNGTIIPPNTTSSGKETVGFTESTDPTAPGGAAAHGTCPPARALRAVAADAGFPLPTGMTWEYHAVLFGYNPATGIKVTNTGDNPVQIVMWTTGSATNTKIYAMMIKLAPN